jgi:hypothetical protein
METEKQTDCHVLPPRNYLPHRHYEASITEVISWIETEQQTDCHVVPPRNDLTHRHYEGSMTEVIS